KSKASVTSPSAPRSSTVAARVPSRHTPSPSPNTMRSPDFSRLAGRARAVQRLESSRPVSVTEMCAEAPSRSRVPLSSAGMTLVSLNTSASPGESNEGSSAIIRSAKGGSAPGSTTSSRVARAHRPERDQLLRQMVVELVDAHGDRTQGSGSDGGDPHGDDLVGLGRRLAARDLVDILHALADAPPH